MHLPLQLYDYYRSSASFRVRIALNLKNIPYDKIPVHLLNNGGEQHHQPYSALNPQELVPTLIDEPYVLTQSLAIIEYINEMEPSPPFLPATAPDRALIRSLSLLIACEIHPPNNLRVLNQLRSQFGADDGAIKQWIHHWIKKGFTALETRLKNIARTQPVCFGQQVSLADICLIPQVFSAKRFEVPLDDYPCIKSINDHCLSLESFQKAFPKED